MRTINKKKVLKIIGRIFLFLILLFFVLVMVIRSPWGQDIIVSKLTDYISNKTNTKVAVGSLFITFSGDIQLEEVYLEDKAGDTLLYSKSLQLDLPIYPLLFKNEISVDDVDSEGLVANVTRGTDPEQFNFSFLLDAFASPTDTTTTTEPMSIDLGDFSLADWKVRYTDEYLGTNLNLKIGKLDTSLDLFDLEEMKYTVSDFSLENTDITYLQNHEFPVTEDTTSTPLPTIKIGDFDINSLNVKYTSKIDGISTDLKLGQIKLTDVLADVALNQYETDDLLLKNSDIKFNLRQSQTTAERNEETSTFIWPEFVLAASTIELENNSFQYSQDGVRNEINQSESNTLQIDKLKLNAEDFAYRPKKFNITVDDFSFQQRNGIRLDQFSFAANLTDTNAKISDLTVQFNQSSANADISLAFNSFDDVLQNPEKSTISANLDNLTLEIEDVQQLLPELSANAYLDSLAAKPITGSLKANGNLQKVDDFNAKFQWGSETEILASGSLSNLTKPDSLQYDFNDINLTSTKTDIAKFVSAKDLGISIPETLNVKGSLSGTSTSIATKTTIQIPEGLAKVEGSANFGTAIAFDGAIETDSLQLGKLLQNEQLGFISLQLKGSGSGTKLADMNASIDGAISQLQLNGYNYQTISLEGNLVNGSGAFSANIKDPNLNLNANANLDLVAESNTITFSSNIIGADLKKLGFTKNDIKIASNIDGTYTGTTSNYTVDTAIKNSVAVAANEQYQIEPILLRAHIEDSITDISITSGFLNGELYSNASPNRINKALKKQLESYFSNDSSRTVADSVTAKLRLSVRPTPILTKVFFDGFKDLDSLNIDADFDSKKQSLYAEVKVPKISYSGSSVDSLNVLLNGNATDLNFSAGLGELLYEPIHLKKTYLTGNLKNKELVLDFNAENDSVQVMHIASELVFQKDTLRLHIDPEALILNKKQWNLPSDNSIVLAESYINLKNLTLSRNNQSLQVSTKVPKMEQDHIGVLFENFELQTFLSLINPDEALAKGRVQGDFVLLNPYGASGLASDIEIENFQIMENPLGTLTLDASSKSFSNYDFDLALKDGDAKLRLTGDYVAKENDADLNMELDIQKIKTSVVQRFFKDELSNAEGSISGSMLVGGTLSDPTYSGRINFNGAGLTLTSFNTSLMMSDETLDLDEDKISLSNFNIQDKTKGTLVLDGSILTPDLLNPGFDLSVKADRFRVLDSKKGDNELVYGIASINADLNVTGTLNSPVVNGILRVRDITDLNYIVPQDQLDIQERDGVVIFVNRENPDAILTRNEGENKTTFFSGMDINTTLEISNDAKFTVILDEKTQDKLQASGDATLNLNIDPNQDIRLSGRLELTSGFYRTSLYNLVSREFQIRKGSSIVWSGDPYDAKLDVTAIYEIENLRCSVDVIN